MAALTWDGTGKRYYETGVDRGVLYTLTEGAYNTGVAWNGLINLSESPDGAEPNDMYADNRKYGSIRSAENFKATLEAYTYPEEFAACDGYVELAAGVVAGQQPRKPFGLSYRTMVNNDEGTETYKLHLVYGCTASPSEKAYATINDSPEAMTFSWEISTDPVTIAGHKDSATLIIDSAKATPEGLKALEDALYGGGEELTPRLPLPAEVLTLLATHTA